MSEIYEYSVIIAIKWRHQLHMKKSERLWISYLIIIFLSAGTMLLFSSTTSPLYPNNYGVDSAFFRFVGLMICRGNRRLTRTQEYNISRFLNTSSCSRIMGPVSVKTLQSILTKTYGSCVRETTGFYISFTKRILLFFFISSARRRRRHLVARLKKQSRNVTTG